MTVGHPTDAQHQAGLARDSRQTTEHLARAEVVHVELCRRPWAGGSDVTWASEPGGPRRLADGPLTPSVTLTRSTEVVG